MGRLLAIGILALLGNAQANAANDPAGATCLQKLQDKSEEGRSLEFLSLWILPQQMRLLVGAEKDKR